MFSIKMCVCLSLGDFICEEVSVSVWDHKGAGKGGLGMGGQIILSMLPWNRKLAAEDGENVSSSVSR